MTTEIQKTDERGGWTSASNASADRRCAGRHQAQKGLPDRNSEDANFGREIHNSLLKGSPEGLKTDQLAIYEQCVELTEKLMDQFFGSDKVTAEIVKEFRYWCKINRTPGIDTDRLSHSGQVDFVARRGNRVLIIDYKMLPGDVPESSSNEQLRDLAVLVAGNYGLRSECSIGTAIAQPLVTHNPEICLYNSESILRAEQEMFTRVRESNNPHAQRTAGTAQCKFCLAKFQCKEYAEWSESLLPITTKVVGLPVHDWTPDMRAYYCEMRGSAKKWLEECDAEMKRLLEDDPASIPGWKLEPGNVIEKVTEPEVLFTRFREVAKKFAEKEAPGEEDKLITELFMQCVKIGKEDFNTQLRKVTGLKGKELKAAIDLLMSGVTSSKQNQPSLAKLGPNEPQPVKVVADKVVDVVSKVS